MRGKTGGVRKDRVRWRSWVDSLSPWTSICAE